MCEVYCGLYPYLNHDLLITAAAFHDVGKLKVYIYKFLVKI